MKPVLMFAVFISIVSSAPAGPIFYLCRGESIKHIAFHIQFQGGSFVMRSGDESCEGVVDPTYKPTEKYKGYTRYLQLKEATEACTTLTTKVANENAGFDSIKTSPEISKGQKTGRLTFIYDTGDFHGRLVNAFMTCKQE